MDKLIWKTDQNCYKQKLKNQNNPTLLKKSVIKDHLTNKTPGPNGSLVNSYKHSEMK